MILKDQTTSSTSDSTKTKPALLDKYKDDHQKEVDGYERLKTKETNKLPNPTGWRMLVLPFKMPEKTKGGLFLGQDTLERQQVGSTCGLVLAMGPHCYDKDKFPDKTILVTVSKNSPTIILGLFAFSGKFILDTAVSTSVLPFCISCP